MSWELYSVHSSREAALAAVAGYDSSSLQHFRVRGRNVECWEAPGVPSETETPALDLRELRELQKVQNQLIVLLAQVNNMVNRYAVD